MSSTPIILPPPAPHEPGDSPTDASAARAKTAIAAAAPFSGLSDAIIEAVAENADERRYAAGQTVFSMGQFDGAEFFVVASGRMKVSAMEPTTGAVVVEHFPRYAAFALELVFCGEEPTVFSRLAVTAEEDLVLIAIDAEALRTIAGQRPSLMRNLANHFALELSLRRFNAVSAEAAPQQRILRELLKFIERDRQTGLWRVPKMPRHRELADRADVDESAAAGAVAMLIQDGVARRDYPGLIIDDLKRLNDLAG